MIELLQDINVPNGTEVMVEIHETHLISLVGRASSPVLYEWLSRSPHHKRNLDIFRMEVP
ncbi:hypothetical protein [Scytonema sp. NUACC21]